LTTDSPELVHLLAKRPFEGLYRQAGAQGSDSEVSEFWVRIGVGVNCSGSWRRRGKLGMDASFGADDRHPRLSVQRFGGPICCHVACLLAHSGLGMSGVAETLARDRVSWTARMLGPGILTC
jgi:hypothetical protein